MATKIVTKNSSTSGSAPLASDLVQGELAVNVTDKRLYTENASGTIVEVGTNPSTLTVTGEITANGGIALGDNDKATFGAGDDLQIFHDGSSNSSYIKETGTGSFNIEATNLFLKREGGTESFIDCVTNGAVTAYYDGSAKLATTATGIDVTGDVVADGLTVAGDGTLQTLDGAILKLRTTDTSALADDVAGAIYFETDDPSRTQGTRNSIESILLGGQANTRLKFKSSQDDGALLTRMDIDSNGDISFYEDTGTTPKLFWDASAESLCINNTNSSARLVVGGTRNDATIELLQLESVSNWSSGDALGSLVFSSADPSGAGSGTKGGIHYKTTGGTGSDTYMAFNVAGIAAGTNDIERMRIDSSGRVGIGTDSPQALTHLYTESGINTADTLLKLTNVANTARYVGFQAQRDNASGQGLNILITKTDASVVNALTIDTAANVGIGTSSPATALSVVGDITTTGGVYLGGTGAANKLDDYEEGDATGITCTGSTSGSATVIINNATYTKIGNVVNLYLYLTMDFSGDDIVGDIEITNLPFSNANNNLQNVSIIHQTISTTYLTLGARVTSNLLRVQTNSTSSGLARADCVNSANRVMMIGATYNTDA